VTARKLFRPQRAFTRLPRQAAKARYKAAGLHELLARRLAVLGMLLPLSLPRTSTRTYLHQ
jgi:hypothetical protein